jgi:hypothetical protein
MTVKASAALILMTGLLVGFAAPMPATAAGEDDAAVSKHESSSPATGSRTAKQQASRKSSATKSEAGKKDDSRKAGENHTADAAANPPAAVAPSLANANAQMVTDAPVDSAKGMSAAMSDKANNVLHASSDKPADTAAPAESGVVASDQLNDFDRGLQAAPIEQPVTQTVAIATVKPTLASTSQAASSDSSTLDRTSLIGKIFIAFGALLTVASAARMFMA